MAPFVPLKVDVEQKGIDVVVHLRSPDGVQPPQADLEPWGRGKETILWEAAVAGAYRIEIHAWRPTTPAGRYAVRWTEILAPAERELALLRANRLCAQAINHMHSGKYDEGIALAEEAIRLWEGALPPDAPGIAEGLYWLIYLLENKEDISDVERIAQLYERGLRIKERAFGADHPHIARWLNDLANKTELVRAIGMFERAVAILEKHYGPDHPDVGTLLSNFAVKLDAYGDYARAEAMYKRAASIREQAVGSEDDVLAHSRY